MEHKRVKIYKYVTKKEFRPNAVLNLIECTKKNNYVIFWRRSLIAPYVNVMRIHEKLISYVKLDRTIH